MTKYYVDIHGAYLGGFAGANPPPSAIKVPSAPNDARQVWNGSSWGAVVPTPAEVLETRLAAGCAIISSGVNPDVVGTWALDMQTQQQIAAVATSAAQFGLPRGRSVFNYPDITGMPHALTVAQLGVLFVTLRDYIDELYETAATLEAGGPASWPAQPVAVA